MKHHEPADQTEPPTDHRATNPLTLEQAIIRVTQLANLGYTESIVLNDLRIRVEKMETELSLMRESAARFRVQP